MKRLKAAKRALLGLNLCLAVGIVAFTIRFLVSPPRVDRLSDIRGIDPNATTETGRSSSGDESVLRTLPNPLGPAAKPSSQPPFQSFTLKGAIPAQAPNQGVAFMRSTTPPVDLTARTGEDILRDGKPAPEFQGWRLADVWKDHALFVNRAGERYELHIETALSGPSKAAPMAPRPGEPYRSELEYHPLPSGR